MPKTIKIEAHLSSEELENHYRKARDPVARSHYQIIWLISEGKSTRQVMEVTGYCRGWIQQLARRYKIEIRIISCRLTSEVLLPTSSRLQIIGLISRRKILS